MSEEKNNQVVTLNYSAEELAKLSEYSETDGAPSDAERLPILKINYTPMVSTPEQALADQAAIEISRKQPPTGKLPANYVDTGNYTIPKGAYVVGQQKDKNGKVTVQGEEVDQMVIFKIRNQYGYYDKKDTKNNCHSPVHEDFKEVVGNNYGFNCRTECPFRAKDRQPRCQLSKVVFVSAITKSRQAIGAVMYIKGASFMGFAGPEGYIKAAVNVDFESVENGKTKTKKVKIPTYSFVTKLLPAEFKTNGTVDYWISRFEKDKMFSIDIVEKFHKESEALEDKIAKMNQRTTERMEDDEDSSGGRVAVPVTEQEVADGTAGQPGIVTIENQEVDENDFNPENLYK
jgi:hypothetical protein